MVFVIKCNIAIAIFPPPKHRDRSDPSHVNVFELGWVNYFTLSFHFLLLFHCLYFCCHQLPSEDIFLSRMSLQ